MKKRIVPLVLSAAMLVSLATSCTNTAENTPSPSQTQSESPAPTPSETAIQDGYIPAPYTADASQTPTEYLAPVFYQNEDGPTISVIYNGVIVEDGKYFRDSNNNQELDTYEDWRLSTDERVADLLGKMTQEQRIGLLRNALVVSPAATTADEVYDENGNVILEQLVTLETETEGEGETDPMAALSKAYTASAVLDAYTRSGVIRKDTDTETGALFNNALNMLAEYVGATKGEVTIPYMIISNPMTSGYPSALGFGAVVTGDGNADAVKAYAEMDAEIWDAKGIHHMYGPQIDLVSDPRWSRNNSTYGEREDMSAEIASNLVIGYQNGDQGMVEGSVLVTVKHFPGDGAAYNGFESHGQTGRYRIYSTENSLADYQLKSFIAAFEAGAAGVMPGYSQPIIDERIAPQSITYNGETYDIRLEGRGNAFNEDVLQYLLREVLGFNGLINSDSLMTNAQQGVEDLTSYERMVLFIKAGCDCGVISFDDATPAELLEQALTNGDLTREDLERAAANRLLPQMQSGNLDNPYRDLEESVATVDEVTPKVEALAEEMNLNSVVLMKNSESALPLSDTSVKVYVQGFNQKDDADVSGMISALEAEGFTVVDDYNEADVAYLRVDPTIVGTGSSELAILDLAEDVETPVYDNNAKRTEETAEITTVSGMDDFQKIADAVHANGGKVIGEINASNAWILTEMEPYCDALLGTFKNTDESIAQVVSGKYNPTGKLPLTMVADASVIALVETDLNGEVWDVCVSPNDVPGYVKDQYMDADVLAASPSGSYAYKDADGNLYQSGFGLSY